MHAGFDSKTLRSSGFTCVWLFVLCGMYVLVVTTMFTMANICYLEFHLCPIVEICGLSKGELYLYFPRVV
jgi:hypothetical protein